MGRGSRGAGSGRGGRRGGRSHGPPRGQAAATVPTGEALLVELRAAPEFFEALKGRECPARSHEGGSGATPLGTSELELADWRQLGALISWFRDGLAADGQAELAFSPRLTKALRASVHGTATAVGLGALGTASRGLGEARRVVVMDKRRAERSVAALDEKQDHKAFWIWRWAQQQDIQVSRDEVAEMIVKDALTPQLQELWEVQAARQRGVRQLCAAAAAGDLAAVEAALEAQPGLLADKAFDVDSGVAPLHVATKEGQVAALELLLSKGADLEMRDGHGWTALQVSRKYEQSDAEGALLRAGAHDPDKHKSILEKRAVLRSDAARPALNGVVAAAKPPSAPASEGGVDGDSNASVCGTERDNVAAEVSSNADDYADPAYRQPATVHEALEEEGSADEEEEQSESARAQAEAVALAAKAAAEAQAAAEEAAAEEEAAAAEAAAVPDDATQSAVDAFNAAVAAATAAEAAAEEAEALGGSEAAERAAAFRLECEAAVVAAAAAAVAAGDALDDVLPPAGSRGAIQLASSPPGEPNSSVASVCDSEMTHVHSIDTSDFAFSTAGSVLSAAASATTAGKQAATHAGGDEAAAADAPGAAVPAAAAAEAPHAEAVVASPREASAAAVADLQAKTASAAEQAIAAATQYAEAASKAASAARAELEAKLPQWSVWVQENPGSVMAGAGVAAAAVAALLLFSRRR